MKIEMGESLVLSWLRHVKECQIVQTNWKASNKWELNDQEILEQLRVRSQKLFASKYGYDIYKGSTTLKQILQQAEIDALGISFTTEGMQVYAVDVAFHEAGLNYGDHKQTIARIIKKYLRTGMCMLGYFGRYTGELVFASPKINPAEYHGLMDCLDDINGVLAEFKLPYTTRLIANEDFKVHILEPVLHAMNNVADTSELFLRSLQLYNMFATKQPVSTAEAKSDGPRKITQSFESIEGSGIKGLGEMKVGAIARTVLRKTLESGRISESEIALLQTKEYSKEKFDIQFPLLRKASGKDEPKPNRYYDNPLNINGTYYFLCSEWFGKAPNNDLPYLLNWLALHTE